MVDASKIRKGLKILENNDLLMVVDFQFVKPGKGNAFTRTKMRNLRTGNMIEKTYKSGEKLATVVMDEKDMQYLYNDGDNLVFMDNESYEQTEIPKNQIGDSIKFLKENTNILALFYEGEVLSVELPNFVELLVTEAPPNVKGNSVSSSFKPVTLETGAVIDAPLFIEVDTMLKIDTRTGEYVERVK